MTIEAVGSIGELIAAIATVATLFYLAVQIRHSTEVTHRQAALDRAATLTSPFFASSELAVVLSKIQARDGLAPGPQALVDRYDLTPAEAILWERHLALVWSGLEADYAQSGESQELDSTVRNLLFQTTVLGAVHLVLRGRLQGVRGRRAGGEIARNGCHHFQPVRWGRGQSGVHRRRHHEVSAGKRRTDVEFVGGIAVIATLIYLAVQTRQARCAAVAHAPEWISDSFRGWLLSLRQDADFSQVFWSNEPHPVLS